MGGERRIIKKSLYIQPMSQSTKKLEFKVHGNQQTFKCGAMSGSKLINILTYVG
jgi:hypothetical protein